MAGRPSGRRCHSCQVSEYPKHSPSISADWKALAALCCQLPRDHPGLDGIVIGHGTATIEETAYFLNLTLKTPVPVVLVVEQLHSSAL